VIRRRGRRLPWKPEPGRLAVVRVLLHLQAGFALLSAVGTAAMGAGTGYLIIVAPTIAVTAAGGLAALILVPCLERGSRRARRLVVAGEAVVLLFALVDLGLAVALTYAPLDLTGLLTRIVLPVAVLRLLRRTVVPRTSRGAVEVAA
jgi:hypothetical protein